MFLNSWWDLFVTRLSLPAAFQLSKLKFILYESFLRPAAGRVQVCGDGALEGGAQDPQAGRDPELHPGGPALLLLPLLLWSPPRSLLLLLTPLGGSHQLRRGRGLL